jgi:hypothetical protein
MNINCFTHRPSSFLPVVPTTQHLEQDVINYDYKPEIALASRVTSFATAGLDLNLTIKAWPTLIQTFLLDASHVQLNVPGCPACPILPPIDQLFKQVLSQYPTNMLVLGDLSPPQLTHWRSQIPSADIALKLVLEFWEPHWSMRDTGPMAKLVVTQWLDLGYESTCQTLNGLQVGGVALVGDVVDCVRWVVVRVNASTWGRWAWPDFPWVVL